jgi:hypothetical protein
MKEFDLPIKNLSKGLVNSRDNTKEEMGLEECHNLEPLGKDYRLHEFVVDINSDSYAWGNP